MIRWVLLFSCLMVTAGGATQAPMRGIEQPYYTDNNRIGDSPSSLYGIVNWPDGTTSLARIRFTGEGTAMLSKSPDKASPGLRHARETGERLPRVRITGREETWILEDVRIASLRVQRYWGSETESLVMRYKRREKIRTAVDGS